ncbi:MT-A70 family methyltransferase [Corynebacterium dentalis]|uniref:MT-A70 family methyltransferase n=1 Tax=Corynebacterium dentalis TaxID=2014528 RepID=UPI00289AF2D4|nr:MT-A70 family methyltransferase [Corynebacterium dentalis]
MSHPTDHTPHQPGRPATEQAFQPRWTTTSDGLVVPAAPGSMLVPPPKRGRYKVVLADPPWDVFQKSKHGAGEHYELMTRGRISEMSEAIKFLAAEQSFCFMWVTTATEASWFSFRLLNAQRVGV